jgi:hypothetical protein
MLLNTFMTLREEAFVSRAGVAVRKMVDWDLETDCEALVLSCVIARPAEPVPTMSAVKRANMVLVNIVECPTFDERVCSAIEFALRGIEVTFAQFTMTCSIRRNDWTYVERQ